MELKEPEIITFKSKPEYWNKESLGLKRNTIRKDDDSMDYRFQILRKYMSAKVELLNIMIQNTETGDIFLRKVTDVSFYDGYFIISW